jgi:protein-L-isoaspartate(D-aspartate) O-methyltransferase
MQWGANLSRVARAMREVRREFFLPASQRAHAGKDTALPIGCEQTISQPSLVAQMTEQLDLTAHTRVLEIGTGSGYQTAILAEVAGEVFTIERVTELAVAAQARLKSLGYRNIHFRTGDGALGWPEEAPFGAIIVTAAPETLPPALVEQLEPGGKLVAPIGSVAADNQILMLVEKDRDGVVMQRELCPVRFVPLISGEVRSRDEVEGRG